MIRLTRSIDVTTFDVEATVAVGRDRPELLAVARLAADLGRPIGARDVLSELLGPRPEVLGQRVIDRCVDLGLLERLDRGGEARLSASGRVALDHGEVLVPEEGIWRFFLIDDPLVPGGMVSAIRLETPLAHAERSALKTARNGGERPPPSERIPDLLHACKEGPPRPSVRDNHLCQLLELGARGTLGPRGKMQIVLTWDERPEVRLTGVLPSDGSEGKAIKLGKIDATLDRADVLSRLTHDALWIRLAAKAANIPEAELQRWHKAAGHLVVPHVFASLPEPSRRSFRRNIEVVAPVFSDLGRFDTTALEDVSIVPAAAHDAQAWFSWLEWDSVNDYLLPGELAQRSQALLAKFPHHRVVPHSPSDLLARARAERGERAWFLLAPSDLGLWS